MKFELKIENQEQKNLRKNKLYKFVYASFLKYIILKIVKNEKLIIYFSN